MTEDMPKKLPFLQKERTRHGTTVWYVRIDRGPRIRIRGKYGSEEFMMQYRAAVSGVASPQAMLSTVPPNVETFEWLFDQWRKSSAWKTEITAATRQQRELVLCKIIAENPTLRFKDITPKHIFDGRERRQETPAAANNFVKVMRAIFAWAKEQNHVDHNPASQVPFIKYQTDGYRPWSREDVEKFRTKWPLGTYQRVALEVLVNTGLRRGDAVRLGRQHIRDGVATIRTEKTGVEIHIPILPLLREAIAAGPTGDLSFICGVNGRPRTKESFGNWFRAACKEAKVPGSAHGLRKLAATIMADNGASEKELQAVFGWETNSQSSVYTRAADRKRLAQQGVRKLLTDASGETVSEQNEGEESRTSVQVRD